MSKKDVLIFLNIYLIMLKGRIKKVNLQIFKDDVIEILSYSKDFFDFLSNFTWYRYSLDPYKIGFYFDKFLRKIQNDIDKIG